MRPLTPHLIDFLDAHRVGVLATVDRWPCLASRSSTTCETSGAS